MNGLWCFLLSVSKSRTETQNWHLLWWFPSLVFVSLCRQVISDQHSLNYKYDVRMDKCNKLTTLKSSKHGCLIVLSCGETSNDLLKLSFFSVAMASGQMQSVWKMCEGSCHIAMGFFFYDFLLLMSPWNALYSQWYLWILTFWTFSLLWLINLSLSVCISSVCKAVIYKL